MKNKYIIAAYSASGKSFFTRTNPNILSWEYPIGSICRSIPENSNLYKTFLADYIKKEYKHLFEEYNDILLLCYPGPQLIEMYQEGYPVIFIIPDISTLEKKQNYLQRYLKRGSINDFNFKKGCIDSELKLFNKINKSHLILLNENEYLSDVIRPYLSEEDQIRFDENRKTLTV